MKNMIPSGKFMRSLTATLFFGLQLFGQDGTRQPVRATTTERVNFAPGGVIRLTAPSSNLFVEAWDRPEVEITTIKSTLHSYQSNRQDQAAQCLENVKVVTERRSATELAISTILPSHSFFTDPLGVKCGATVEQHVNAPRDSRLVIDHGAGFVMVSRISGDIEVSSRSGDIVLMLPDPGPYSIDAKSKFGGVSSDFAGSAHREKLIGEQFASANPSPSRRIHLRIGFGGITIKEVPPTPEAPVAAGVP
jgi:hypothetical protein